MHMAMNHLCIISEKLFVECYSSNNIHLIIVNKNSSVKEQLEF